MQLYILWPINACKNEVSKKLVVQNKIHCEELIKFHEV